jgi:glycine cleavage system T protein (aminomethyltransferase)
MPIGSAVHARTLALCESLSFREWSGYYAVSAFEAHHDHEYNAIRNAAALIDVSPLFKYLVRGPDSAALVDRVITRPAVAMAIGQVYYTPWCDENGKVIDDGTVTRVSENAFRWTAADPSLRWISENAAGLNVDIEDISEQVAALALQGPTSAGVLAGALDGGSAAGLETLKYFRMMTGSIGGVRVEISRTGYTGDLGYEIWMPWNRALDVWDTLMSSGNPFGIRPAGMLALDVARVEAGLLLIDVDFHSSRKALLDSQCYSPYEMGLGRLVQLDKGPFVGREALAAEQRRGSPRRIVGLDIAWPAVERLYDALGMPPQISAATSRVAVPVYTTAGEQVGRATSTTWSPILKRLIALATIDAPFASDGAVLDFEFTVEAVRHRVPATVVKTPFFNPARKTAAPSHLTQVRSET